MKTTPITPLLLALVLVGSLAVVAQAKPLSDADIRTLVDLDVASSEIVETIDKNGYSGATDDESLKKLLQGGAAPEVILAVKRAGSTSAKTGNPPEEKLDAATSSLRSIRARTGLGVEISDDSIQEAISMADFLKIDPQTPEYINYIKEYAKAAEKQSAINKLKEKAEAGDAAAQFEYAYYNKLDPVETAEWYRKAATQGHREAQYYLAEKYLHGEGVERSLDEAVKWYHKAAEQGHLNAQTTLAHHYRGGGYYFGGEGPKNPAESTKWRLKAAEQGDRESQLGMGYAYKDGYGIGKNIIEAIKWYRKAADQGHWQAQYELGSIFYDGRETPQNYPEAIKWWHQSAQQGYTPALYAMGYCFQHGHGVEKNTTEAGEWYRKAAAKGHEAAKKALTELNK